MKAASLGIGGYLLKPFVAQQFVSQVRKTCDGGKSEPANEALQPIESVLERLGVELKTYVDLLHVFTKDVGGLLEELRKPSVTMNQQEMRMRLGGLHGAGRSLGADSLVAAIVRLEEFDPSADSPQLRTCISSLQQENERVREQATLIARKMDGTPNAVPELKTATESPTA